MPILIRRQISAYEVSKSRVPLLFPGLGQFNALVLKMNSFKLSLIRFLMQCCTGVCGSTRNLTDLNVPVTRRCGAGEQHVERERIRVGIHVQVNVLAVVGATDAWNVVG